MSDSEQDIKQAIAALKEHATANSRTAGAVEQLIDSMREQQADMQEHHRDNVSTDRLLMLATVVMTVATVVMAYAAVSP